MTCVTTFKAKCDGFADDTQALKDAVKYAHEAGDEISFPRGAIVKHTEVWDIGSGDAFNPSEMQSIRIRGGITSSEMTPTKHAVRLVYDGPNGAPCQVRINGPIVPEVIGLALDGNFKAGGLHAMHSVSGRFERLHAYNWRGEAFKQEAIGQPLNCTAGSARNEWKYFSTSQPGGTDCVALTVGQPAATYQHLDPARNDFRFFNLGVGSSATSVGIRMRHCDIQHFESGQIVSGLPINQTQMRPVQIVPPTWETPPSPFHFLPAECSFSRVATIGRWDVPDTSVWNPSKGRGIFCNPFLTGDVETLPDFLPAHPAIWGFTTEGQFFRNGQVYRMGGRVGVDHTPLACTNTLALTPLATALIKAHALGAEGTLRVNANGAYWNPTGAATWVMIQVAFGGVPVFSIGPYTIPAGPGWRAFNLANLTIKQKNAGGQSCYGVATLGQSPSMGPNASITPYIWNQGYQTSLDPTQSQELTFSVQHGTAHADIRFELKDFDVELY